MRKSTVTIVILLLLIVSVFGYIQIKKWNAEKSVVDYLLNVENYSEDDIVSSEPFIANLSGDKNWMVSIEFKNDENTYFYYKQDNEIILESIVVDGHEYSPEEYKYIKK